MPTYVYEIVGEPASEPFEVRQAMSDAPLTVHPELGVPVRRVISGGRGPLTASHGVGASVLPALSGGCGSGCACH